MYRENVGFVERIIAAVSYFTFGFAGAIYYVIMTLMKKNISTFLHYHIWQGIFLYLLFFILSFAIRILFGIIEFIPFVKVIPRQLAYLFNTPVVLNYSILQLFIYTLMGYLIITSLMGLYSYLPWVSKIISENVGRRH